MPSPTPSAVPAGRPRDVTLALGALYLVWGATYLAIDIAVVSLPPCWLGGVRMAVAGVLLLGAAVATRQAWPAPREVGWAAVMGFFTIFAINGLVVYAQQAITSGMAALLIASLPLWLVVLGGLLGERPRPAALAGCLLGMAGVGLLCWRDMGHGPAASLVPHAMVLLGALMSGVGVRIGKRVALPASGLHLGAWSHLAAAVCFACASALRGEQVAIAAVPPQAWLAMAFLVVFGSLVGYSCYFWLVRHARPEVLATYAFVNPVIAVALGALVLGEPLDAGVLVGGAAVVGAVGLVSRPDRGPGTMAADGRARLWPSGSRTS